MKAWPEFNEAEWKYTVASLPLVRAGRRVKGWSKVDFSKLPTTAKAAKMIRLRLHVSQKDFAKTIGASLATVKAWESGARKPDGVATKVLRLLGREPGLAKRLARIAL